jgi:isocitrate dehydrogenase
MAAEPITAGLDGKIVVPDEVIIPYIEGDGVGPDIWKASEKVFNAAVQKIYGTKKKIEWKEILAGEKAFKATGSWLPDETNAAIQKYRVAIKGPLATPVGGGIRSINVALRQIHDLYGCVRPVRYYPGVPAPNRFADRVNMMIFRENTEDVYAGLEFQADSKEAQEIGLLVERLSGKSVLHGSAIGIKPVSRFASKRLVKMAIEYAIQMKAPSVTLVHKGNIQKFTEGAFCAWGYEVAKEEFGDFTITEQEVTENAGKTNGKVIIKDRIADNMFQQIQTRPAEYSVLATTNLNGDYLSDAAAALVGGLGLAPGANIGHGIAVFEATHGTAPKYAGLDKINPSSLILSGKMMFDFLGWTEVGSAIDKAVEKCIAQKIVTYDLARDMEGATEVSCSGFADTIIKNL